MTIPTSGGQIWPAPGIYGVAVRQNTGSVVGTRPRLNLIEGTGVTLTVADDSTDNEVDVTIAVSSVSAFGLDDLSDVDTTTTTPTDGALLAFDGTQWRVAHITTDSSGDVVVDSSGNVVVSYS